MREWVKIARSATTGYTTVTVTVMEGSLVSKYGVKCTWSEVRQSVKTARTYAAEGLGEMRAAIEELEEAA